MKIDEHEQARRSAQDNKMGGYTFILAALSGVLLSLSFPDYSLWLLGWLGLTPLLIALYRQTVLTATIAGWVMGLFYFGLSLTWVKNTMTQFGHMPLWLALVVNGLMVTILALYPSFFAYCYSRIARRSGEAGALAAAPVLWVSMEFLRSHFWFLAFPWLRLADSQYLNPHVIQIADLAGEEGVGFVMVTVNCAIYLVYRWAVSDRKKSGLPIRYMTAATLLLVATFIYGEVKLGQYKKVDSAQIPVAIIQGNIDQQRKWERAYRKTQIELYLSRTREAVANGAAFVVWPESAAPFYFNQDIKNDQSISELAADTNTPLLFGAPAYKRQGERTISYNRAWAVRPDGRREKYDKVHLVPFGEYVPLKNILYFLEKSVTAIGDMEPGEKLSPLNTGLFPAGVQICFEIVFPKYSRKLVANGATVLVNITNDSWFGRSAASRQSLAMAVYRAVENRRPLLRAAQSGVSAVITSSGKIEGETKLFEEALLYGNVTPKTMITLYTATGSLFSWLSLAATGFFLFGFKKYPR